ncbi:MAG: class I SAM-dependent methyltransferase [Bacteroidota bacterium]|nr:class I SAM-dependent methyltransferase [Bacteroidota bacterium]
MVKEEYYRMADTEKEHWWYRSLHFLVLSHIKKYFNERNIKIIDAGCGTGGLITFMKKQGYINIDGFDASDIAVQICNKQNIAAFKGDLRNISKYYMDNHADVVISNDTFYFLDMEDQRNLTDEVNNVLRKDGLLITNIPSLQAFRGIHDVQVGIKKRFDKKDIWKIFDRNKYSLVTEMYWPFVLSPPIWFARFMQRTKMKMNPDTVIKSDLSKQNKFINSILFYITNFENNMLSRKPFGSSLFLVMKKKS